MCACTGSHTSQSGNDSDSLSAANQSIYTAIFPDTIYPSASAVEAIIEIVDSAFTADASTDAYPYTDAPGIFTFRGNRMRQSCYGHLAHTPDTFTIDWRFKTAEDYTPTDFGIWGGGTGWTGQPLYVEWPDSSMAAMASNGVLLSSNREIILGSLTGEIYFIDYLSGHASRKPINTGNPIKGTISLDPSLNGNLYVGQGIPAHRSMKALVVDLFTNTITDSVLPDPQALRSWSAYDSSPLRSGPYLFRPGENGTIYKYVISPQHLRLHSTLRYRVGGQSPGIESSMAIVGNYGYVADNVGNIICLNINNLRPVWRFKLPDDTDGTPVVELENSRPYLYVGCEQQNDCVGNAVFAKIDGLNGKPVWQTRIHALRRTIYDKHFDGGFYSTALLGCDNCDSLVFANCVKNTNMQNGSLIAFSRASGRIVYEVPLMRYAWSSPVGLTTESGQFFIFTADCAGNAYLIKGSDGTIIHSAPIGANFESTPIAIGNTIVVGSRGNTIYKLTIQ